MGTVFSDLLVIFLLFAGLGDTLQTVLVLYLVLILLGFREKRANGNPRSTWFLCFLILHLLDGFKRIQ